MTDKLKVVIVGSGFGGLCMGIKLKQAGINDFVILEKASDLGGTWRENTYPGAECDVPSALYSYSFEHNDEWEFKWSGQAQILKYQHDTAAKHGLNDHLRFDQAVVSASFDEETKLWQISTDTGDGYAAQHFVTAVGQLHHPSTPTIAGVEKFSGSIFHSAKWDHGVSLRSKRVGVIGNAASAVQFIPEIAKQVAQLTVFQRSANWMLPKGDRPYAEWEKKLSAKVPLITKLYRWSLWVVGEYGLLNAIRGNAFAKWVVKRMSLGDLTTHVKDPELVAKLTPTYEVGAKRVLFTDHYYPALARDNVSLETTSIDSFTEKGLRLADGSEHEFDVVIYGTGFKTNPFLSSMDIRGLNNRSIREAWNEGAQAYLGVSTNGFPNMHMMYGPNTNLGHSSIIIMLEAQARFVMESIQRQDQQGVLALDIKSSVEQEYNRELQARLAKLAFSKVAASWYMDGNKITNNWVGGTREYERRLGNIDWSAYDAVT
jgi:cation diffusion facilitator CzcD-associated flavoprotein CzcO